MRSKFTDLVDAGVASFEHRPIAPNMPDQCPLCKLYNAYWGMATDTHMSISNGEHIITGSMLKDDVKWTALYYRSTWGGINWRQSGVETLSELFYLYKVTPEVAIINGDYVMRLVPCDYECPCCGFECSKVYTAESQIPIRPGFLSKALPDIFERSSSLNDVVKGLNESKDVPGDHWHVHGNKIIGNEFIIEMSTIQGIKVQNDELQKLLDKEGIGELYLVQYKNFFKVGSDDKLWKNVLNKCKFNSIAAKSIDELTPQQWFDEIKSIIATIS